MNTATASVGNEEIAQAFEDCKLLVYSITHKLCHAYHIPFEELLPQAHFGFVKAYHRYKPDRGAKLSTWIGFMLPRHLKTYLKKEHRHSTHEEINEELMGSWSPRPFMLEIESELSEDARLIVGLVVETPWDFSAILQMEGVENKRGFLQNLRQHLEDMGWTKSRITTSFDEIRQALTA